MELNLQSPQLTTTQFLEQLELIVFSDQNNKWKVDRLKEWFTKRKEGKL